MAGAEGAGIEGESSLSMQGHPAGAWAAPQQQSHVRASMGQAVSIAHRLPSSKTTGWMRSSEMNVKRQNMVSSVLFSVLHIVNE